MGYRKYIHNTWKSSKTLTYREFEETKLQLVSGSGKYINNI